MRMNILNTTTKNFHDHTKHLRNTLAGYKLSRRHISYNTFNDGNDTDLHMAQSWQAGQ